ncbi:ParB/RepB/Spo0J family partition protein [Streptomyces sp. NPDC048109]|uniref:ParB/RepB/Spo0J family partition protein n=1 Tax=unclassified Streptomyces TaxID=2593676 RepID=UPI0033D12C6B
MSTETLPTAGTEPSTAPPPAAPAGTEEWSRPTLSPVEMISISTLRPPAHSPRAEGEDPEHARILADSDADLPPIIVHRASMRVIDGMHRLRAASLRQEIDIPVRFFEGPEEEAYILGVAENTRHGRPLSSTERTAAALRILRSHPLWSNRAISAVAGISPKTVATLRSADGAIPEAGARLGRDGRVRPLDASSGRRRAGELIAANPNASLRQIAEAAGISTGTVRDVRDRLRRGEDPVPFRPRPGIPRTKKHTLEKENGNLLKWQSTRESEPRRATPLRSADVRLAERPSEPAELRPAQQRSGVRWPAEQDPASAHANPAHGVGRSRLIDTLSRDPSLRYSEEGRHLLRLLATHMVPEHRREELARRVPPHCAQAVSIAARECAAAWARFAEELDHAARVAHRTDSNRCVTETPPQSHTDSTTNLRRTG